VTNSLPAKRLDKAAVIEPRADLRKRIREDGKRTEEDGKRTKEDGKRPRARALNMLIIETDRILVFKTTRTGTTITIKVYRNRTVKESANT